MHNTLRALLLGTVLSMGAVSFGAAPAAAAVNIDGQVQTGGGPVAQSVIGAKARAWTHFLLATARATRIQAM